MAELKRTALIYRNWTNPKVSSVGTKTAQMREYPRKYKNMDNIVESFLALQFTLISAIHTHFSIALLILSVKNEIWRSHKTFNPLSYSNRELQNFFLSRFRLPFALHFKCSRYSDEKC